MIYINYLFKYNLNIFKYMQRINIQLDHNNLTKMSNNMFKSNSRFAALVDDNSPKKKESNKEKIVKNDQTNNIKSENKEERFNSFKDERPLRFENKRDSRFRPYDEKERERQRLEREAELKAQKEFEEKEKEKIKQESLKIENFPDLIVNVKKENTIQRINYIEKIKANLDKIHENNNGIKIDKDLEDLKPGWCLIKKDPISKKIIIKHHPETLFEEEYEKSEREIGIDILNALVNLHEKRTAEYIELYGYDTWEKMFKSPDWREREAYLERMEEEDEEYNDIEEDDCEEYY